MNLIIGVLALEWLIILLFLIALYIRIRRYRPLKHDIIKVARSRIGILLVIFATIVNLVGTLLPYESGIPFWYWPLVPLLLVVIYALIRAHQFFPTIIPGVPEIVEIRIEFVIEKPPKTEST